MRLFITILPCLAILATAGCKSQTQSGVDASQQLAAARVADVPLPTTTPFDSSPSERSAYLDAYRDGYRSGLVALNVLINYPAVGVTYYTVRTNGWMTGALAGSGAHGSEILSKMTSGK